MSQRSDKLGIGIVGCGVISYQHAQSTLDSGNAELIAASSRTEKNRKKFSKRFKVTMYSEYDEMLKRDDVHAISICTPSGTHLEYGIKAAEAGKHVIVEKPIEVSVERGEELVRSCEKNDVKLAVIYQNRYSNSVLKLKDAVDSGKIGTPVMARGSVKWYRDQDYYSNSAWRGTLDLDGGGALINQSIHTLDLLIWILGDVTTVFGLKDTVTHAGIEAEDNLVASMKFENGTLGLFEASTSIIPAQPRTIEINGSKGTALLKGNEFILSFDEEKLSENGKKDEENFHTKQFREICDAILNEKQPPVSGEEALRSLAAVEGVYDSCRNNAAVNPLKYISQEFKLSKNLYS